MRESIADNDGTGAGREADQPRRDGFGNGTRFRGLAIDLEVYMKIIGGLFVNI